MRHFAVLLALLATLAVPARADDPRSVVQAFYDAYMAQGENGNLQAFTKAQKSRFEPALAALLLDIADNDPNRDEVWLDFDPYINAQMTAETVTVGRAAVANGLASVPVSCSYGGPGGEQPAVKVILRPSGGTWRIANLVYPARDGMEAWDLKSWLQRELSR